MSGPRNNKKKCSHFLAVALSLFSISVVCHAVVPEEETDNKGDRIEEIVVTGSRIARRNFSSPSPIVTLDAVEIKLAVNIPWAIGPPN